MSCSFNSYKFAWRPSCCFFFLRITSPSMHLCYPRTVTSRGGSLHREWTCQIILTKSCRCMRSFTQRMAILLSVGLLHRDMFPMSYACLAYLFRRVVAWEIRGWAGVGCRMPLLRSCSHHVYFCSLIDIFDLCKGPFWFSHLPFTRTNSFPVQVLF